MDMFFGVNNNNSSFDWMTNLSNLCTDYNSIRNGSFAKLAKAYYGKQSSISSSDKSEDKDTVKKSTTTDKKMAQAKTDADELKSSADALTATGTKSLFKLKDITTKDEETGEETTTKGYDIDGITKAVKSFIDDYNSLVKSGSDVTSTNVLRRTLSMTKTTLANKNLLSDVGINITEGNKLSIDEEKFKKADMNKIKTLFNGNNSYADRVSSQAAEISKQVSNDSLKNGFYNNKGNYYNNTSRLLNQFDFYF